MSELGPIGKMMIFAGLALAVLGFIVACGSKWLPLGRLPGDIAMKKGDFSFFFPVVSCIVISILLTIILNLLFRR